MEEKPEFEHENSPEFDMEQEKMTEFKEKELPYFKETQQDLPKDYDATIERLTAKLDQSEPASTEGKALFGVGLAISFILIFAQIWAMTAPPHWMNILHHLVIFAEASIPFAVSFFLKKPKHATLLRLIGIIVLLVYLFTLFG